MTRVYQGLTKAVVLAAVLVSFLVFYFGTGITLPQIPAAHHILSWQNLLSRASQHGNIMIQKAWSQSYFISQSYTMLRWIFQKKLKVNSVVPIISLFWYVIKKLLLKWVGQKLTLTNVSFSSSFLEYSAPSSLTFDSVLSQNTTATTGNIFLVSFQTVLQKDAAAWWWCIRKQDLQAVVCLLIFLDCHLDCCHFSLARGRWQQGWLRSLLSHSAHRARPSAMTSSVVLSLVSAGSRWLLLQRLAQHTEEEWVKIQRVALGVDVISASASSSVSPLLEESEQLLLKQWGSG